MRTWYILGAGNMGVLAAFYLTRAGLDPRLLVPGARAPVLRTLMFDGDRRTVSLCLQALDPADLEEPVARLLVATKAWQTAAAMAPLVPRLAPGLELIRLQNGMGSLADVVLPPAARVIEAVTTSGGWRRGDEHHVVGENDTLMGDGGSSPPAWFESVQACWPGLRWRADIRREQLRKLAVNAVLNPLTAVFDCVNGALPERPDLLPLMEVIAAEVDAVLGRIVPGWEADTMERALRVAAATAANSSSMRSDVRAGRMTEIDFINGWLIRRAEGLGVPVPENRRLLQAVRERHPGARSRGRAP